MKPWTTRELALVREHYPKRDGMLTLMLALDRSKMAIYVAAHRLKLARFCHLQKEVQHV